ncbi:potassium channel family protein [Enterococcus camelliae]|uniref:Trk system potassium uptake protein TrkA n=1 Tax=Enterococcus camelliae TaxID=453959 RepID=A0ABW5THC5_9ENTE
MKVIVVGGGQVGTYIAKALIDSGNTVTVIEKRAASLTQLQTLFPIDCVIAGDSTNPKVLEQAGIVDADVIALVTGADEMNLVTSTIAKFEYGVPRVIGRVNNPKNEWLFTAEMGIDIKVSQANLLANIIIDQIDLDHMVTLMRLNQGDNSIVQATITQHSKLANHYIRDISALNDTVIIAIKRGNETIIPKGDTLIKVNDHVLAYTGIDGGQLFA